MAPAPQHTDRLLGESPAFLEVLDLVSQTAPLSKPVLIVGERGTGKELIAERLHYLSRRWDQEFLKMNCAAINETLLESELVGHEAGAFT
ncbi:MAG: sigma 54-interacting transcriptional regulator, partial [Pseudomonadales bacterium]|nr:sigma 54-interacting transcriptional regulator [Pseudomonadales bacterium]